MARRKNYSNENLAWGLKESGQTSEVLNASKYLKTGGVLVYSTCSIEKDENENITSEFLSENTNFERIYEKTYYPNVDGTDGFYICKIKKN